MYKLEFWFEHGGSCLWSSNEESNKEYGYAVNTQKLPLSELTRKNISDLECEYHSYLNWEYPPDPSPWTEEHKRDFLRRATNVYHKIVNELGENYEVINKLDSCINFVPYERIFQRI